MHPATRELERTNARPPVKAGCRRVVLLRVPEGAVIDRVNSDVTVITPAAVGASLASGSGEQGSFALGQNSGWISRQAARITNLRIDCSARRAIANRDVSLLVHRRAAHPSPRRIRLISTLLKVRDWTIRHVSEFEPADAGDCARANGEVADY